MSRWETITVSGIILAILFIGMWMTVLDQRVANLSNSINALQSDLKAARP